MPKQNKKQTKKAKKQTRKVKKETIPLPINKQRAIPSKSSRVTHIRGPPSQLIY
jgi:hypothetical protein